MLYVLNFNHRAMGTMFESVLVGQDEDHLSEVASALWDEVDRIERLLSRFDPTSEVSRINRVAAQQPVLVDHEVFSILQTCESFWQRTNGYFDVTLGRGVPGHSKSALQNSAFSPLLLDAEQRTLQFTSPDALLDLGGFGKGYVLDRLGMLLKEFRVTSALIHGGTSSVLALGEAPQGCAWPVGIRNPFDGHSQLWQVGLSGRGLSCSEAIHANGEQSDIIDPHSRRHLDQQASCVVLAPTALEAEVLSTALLSMGKRHAIEYIEQYSSAGLTVAWIDDVDGTPKLQWLTPAP